MVLKSAGKEFQHMANGDKMDRALAGIRAERGGRSETECVSRQAHPERETRPQAEKERFPDYYNRQKEQEGRGR
jgi:hypothetical protein